MYLDDIFFGGTFILSKNEILLLFISQQAHKLLRGRDPAVQRADSSGPAPVSQPDRQHRQRHSGKLPEPEAG